MRLTLRWATRRSARAPAPGREGEPVVWDLSLVERALVDAAVDSYAGWREDSAAVRVAYRRWTEAGGYDRPAAFAAYSTALDREQRAGDVYAAAVEYYLRVRRSLRAPGRGRLRA